jgi:hypothetical protein
MNPTDHHPNSPHLVDRNADAREDYVREVAIFHTAHRELVGHLARLGVEWEAAPWVQVEGCQLLIDGCDATGSEARLAVELRAVTGPGDALEAALDGAVEGWS